VFYVGLDLGQRQDFSALAVVEREEQRFAWMAGPREVSVRHLERMELGTPYPRVVKRVCDVMLHPKMAQPNGIRACRLVVDATGVGAPVVDLLRSAGLGVSLTTVTITGGERAHGQGERWHVPRGDLLAGLEVLLEAGELKICKRLREAERLVRELESMQLGSRSKSGGGEHDDLVFAVALAVWRARRAENGFGAARLPGI
jgi:hypothetical protein